MFLSVLMVFLSVLYIYMWGDYMKILILSEVMSLMVSSIMLYHISMDFFSMNYFLTLLIFLITESSLGFILFIFYVSMESDVVKKLNLVQF